MNNRKLVVRLCLAGMVLGLSLTGCGQTEPTEAEIKQALQDEINLKKVDFDRAAKAFPPRAGMKPMCNLHAYIEPTDVKILEKRIGDGRAQYKVDVKVTYTKDWAEIEQDGRCQIDSLLPALLGKPQKERPADGSAYSQPRMLNLQKFEDGWRLIES